MREVARLETLDVSLYKKVSFEPEPQPTGSLVGDALTWAKFTLRPPRGKAIVFADVHLGLDLSRLSADSLRVGGTRWRWCCRRCRPRWSCAPGRRR